MSRLSTIVVATDFSARANRAVKRAARLALEHNAALHLLFVLERQPLDTLRYLIALRSDDTEDRLLASVKSRMSELAELLHSRYGVPAQFRVAEGTSYAEIVAAVDNEGADLLVIGAHGEHYLHDMLFGTTASKVIRTVTAPVLIVRNEEADPYANVLAAVDFSFRSARAMRLARELAPETTICALHAVEVPFEARLRAAGLSDDVIQQYRSQVLLEGRERMAEFLARLADLGAVRPMLEYGHAPVVMAEQRQRFYPDLVVAGRRGEAAEVEVLLGSVTKHIVYEAGCDVLVVP